MKWACDDQQKGKRKAILRQIIVNPEDKATNTSELVQKKKKPNQCDIISQLNPWEDGKRML